MQAGSGLSEHSAPQGPRWSWSPDPRVEAALARTRGLFPPLYPDGTGRAQRLLKALGNPQNKLPPVFHVAGTNGKGSTLAFVEAFLAAAGFRTHKFISPHLVRFEERILPYGQLIRGDHLCDLIAECTSAASAAPVSFFEFYTALALLAFSRLPADAVLLETGVGGRNDATNVVGHSVTSIITRVSFDHMRLLGNTLPEIARHKAGIMKRGEPCILAPQDPAVQEVFAAAANEAGAALYAAGTGWSLDLAATDFAYRGRTFSGTLPRPALSGDHQMVNAATAMAALEQSPFAGALTQENLSRGLAAAAWPGRLQQIRQGHLSSLLPPGWELWLDGAHNDSGAEVLAAALSGWNDGRPLHIITAMKKTKDSGDIYGKIAPFAASVTAISDPPDAPMLPAGDLQAEIAAICACPVVTAENLESALCRLAFPFQGQARILVTGSLYLVGHALRINGGI